MINKLSNSINYLILVLFFLLPFSNAFSSILLYITIALNFINLFLKKEKINLSYPIYIYLGLLIYATINYSLQGSFSDNNKFWRFLPILSLGFLGFTSINKISFIKIQKTSIISCLVFLTFITVKTIIFYCNNHYLPFGNGEQVNAILIIHRPYLGFYILLNIILSFDLFINKKKIFYLFITILFALSLLLILARLSIVSLVIIAVIYAIFYAKINYKIKLVSLLLILGSLGLVLKLNPNTKERFNTESYEKFVDYEPRFVIWKSVYNIANQPNFNQFIGLGNNETVENLLVDNYTKEISNTNKRAYFISERFNTHSQYLDFYLMGGIPYLLLFISFLVSLIIYFRKNYLSTLITISFILFFFVENVFARQLGCLLFTLYIGLCIIKSKEFRAPLVHKN